MRRERDARRQAGKALTLFRNAVKHAVYDQASEDEIRARGARAHAARLRAQRQIKAGR